MRKIVIQKVVYDAEILDAVRSFTVRAYDLIVDWVIRNILGIFFLLFVFSIVGLVCGNRSFNALGSLLDIICQILIVGHILVFAGRSPEGECTLIVY